MQIQRDTLLQELVRILQEQIWHGYRQLMFLSEKMSLTVPQIVVLEKLKERGRPCSMQELIDLTQQSGAALTGVIDRLVKAGFVVRMPYVHDRRVVVVKLTPAGREHLLTAQLSIRASFIDNIQLFSDTELQQFIFLLQKLLAGDAISSTNNAADRKQDANEQAILQTLTGTHDLEHTPEQEIPPDKDIPVQKVV